MIGPRENVAMRYASARIPRIVGPARTSLARMSRYRGAARSGAIALGMLVALLAGTLVTSRLAAAWRETVAVEVIAPRDGKFVATSKGRLFVQDAGPREAVPIVLIHGTAAWSEFWRGTIDYLVGQDHRVVAIDLPPFGFSDRTSNGAYTRADQATRIDEALHALGIERAVLVGHSFGAGPTVETVMRYPGRVRGLVLVAGALGLPEDGTRIVADSSPSLLQRVLAAPLLGEAIVSATITNPLLTRFGLSTMLARKETATDELAAIIQRPMQLPHATRDIARWLQYFLSADASAQSMRPERYRAIAMPTHLIWGDKDMLTPLSQGRRLAMLIGSSRLYLLPGVGHIPQIEAPETFRPILSQALRELLGASR